MVLVLTTALGPLINYVTYTWGERKVPIFLEVLKNFGENQQ